jgi:hypothetical protein
MNDRPRGAKEFQRLLQRHAADIDQLPQRVMHLLRVGVVCAFLDDTRHDDGAHLFIVKGGTAMQLRFGITARATTDLDVVFRGRVDQWIDQLDQAFIDRTWNGFTINRKNDPVQIDIPSAGYEGRDFGSITFEVAIDHTPTDQHELVQPDGIALAVFAIDTPGWIPCLDVPTQIAQKLHACTEPLDTGNDRVRDIIDIWLLDTLLEPDDLPDLRDATLHTFQRRQKHTWPPTVRASPSWATDYPALAAAHPDAPPTIDHAITYLTDLITRIDNAATG